MNTRIIILILAFGCAIAQTGPTIKNTTNCVIELDIEYDCSGIATDKATIEANEQFTIPEEVGSRKLESNQKFCIVMKPTCPDSVMQHIQTLAPLFHEKCTITYSEAANSTKSTQADENCDTPKINE